MSLQRAMDEEVIDTLNSTYHYWDRSLPLLRYQLNRMAIDGEWNTMLFVVKNSPFSEAGQYVDDLMSMYGLTTDRPYTSGDIVTLDDVHRLEKECIRKGRIIHILGTISPIYVEHMYPFWDIQSEDALYAILVDSTVPAEKRLAIAYGIRVPITEDFIT